LQLGGDRVKPTLGSEFTPYNEYSEPGATSMDVIDLNCDMGESFGA